MDLVNYATQGGGKGGQMGEIHNNQFKVQMFLFWETEKWRWRWRKPLFFCQTKGIVSTYMCHVICRCNVQFYCYSNLSNHKYGTVHILTIDLTFSSALELSPILKHHRLPNCPVAITKKKS